MNLLEETIEDIKLSGHVVTDIIFIGSESTGHSCTWDEFTELSNKDYDSGFSTQKVATDLIVLFSDKSKMWRHEYDGSENWEYSTPTEIPKEKKNITSLFTRATGWDSLLEINT